MLEKSNTWPAQVLESFHSHWRAIFVPLVYNHNVSRVFDEVAPNPNARALEGRVAMLEVEREAIVKEAYATSLQILEKEMNVVLDSLTGLGTQSALLAAFCCSFFSFVRRATALAHRHESHSHLCVRA